MPTPPYCLWISVTGGVTGYTAGVTKSVGTGRQRGHIRKRGNSYQVLLYAGVDPLTGRELRMVESTTDRAEATRILNRMRAEVQAQQHARTRATLGAALDAWLRVHEVEANTREGYEAYSRLYIKPALGEVPVGKVTAKMLEDLYAELRRCRSRCDGRPLVDHRAEGPHECRSSGTADRLAGLLRLGTPSMTAPKRAAR